jgi:hypothetical protein
MSNFAQGAGSPVCLAGFRKAGLFFKKVDGENRTRPENRVGL